MDILEWLERIFASYGYLVLLIGLPLDFIALPLPPGQTTLAFTGYLAYRGTLSLLPAWAAAFAGASIGVTATYTIGYQAGSRLLGRFGRRLLIRPEHLEQTRRYYAKYGNRFLFVSFFLPGVRQFTGYFVGMIRVPLRTFAIYAYSGAACWTAAFVGLGYAFGNRWQEAFALAERYIVYIAVILAAGLLLFAIWKLGLKRKRSRPQ